MKPQLIVFGLVIVVVIFYLLRTRLKATEPQPDTDPKRPSNSVLPTQAKQNDKLIIVKGISISDLKNVLTGFCNMYNKESFQALPRLTKFSDREFVITFPFDIDFEIFCYLVNYLEYPMELKWSPEVTAWTTTKYSDTWITEKSVNKNVMLFITFDDTEHDNVYMTTKDNIGYKLGFSLEEEEQLLDIAKRRYAEPDIDISQLTDKEFEDFK